MRRSAGPALVLVLVLAKPVAADDAEWLAMRRVRLTTEASTTQHCTRLAAVSDDSVEDLRRKIVKAGGDTALLTFGLEDMERIYAQVFRCPALPAGVPPPPPGPPPPPPPSPVPATPGPPPPPPIR